MPRGSHSTLGVYAGRVCPGCGKKVVGAHLGGQWLHTTPPGEPQSWHFDCKLKALRSQQVSP